jgi:hypothetical protein
LLTCGGIERIGVHIWGKGESRRSHMLDMRDFTCTGRGRVGVHMYGKEYSRSSHVWEGEEVGVHLYGKE